eukprot:8580840-Pyramimonas_sp.AAC.1
MCVARVCSGCFALLPPSSSPIPTLPGLMLSRPPSPWTCSHGARFFLGPFPFFSVRVGDEPCRRMPRTPGRGREVSDFAAEEEDSA